MLRADRPAGSPSAVSVTGQALLLRPKPPPTTGKGGYAGNRYGSVATSWRKAGNLRPVCVCGAARPSGGARVSSAHGRDGETADDGHDRRPLPPARVRLPVLRDLRRHRVDVRLRP